MTRTDYWLDRNARPILKTVRVGVRQDVSGSKNKDTTASMNRSSNTVIAHNISFDNYLLFLINLIR